jgi:hypothetical protein
VVWHHPSNWTVLETLGAVWNETPDAAADMHRRRHWVFALPNV